MKKISELSSAAGPKLVLADETLVSPAEPYYISVLSNYGQLLENRRYKGCAWTHHPPAHECGFNKQNLQIPVHQVRKNGYRPLQKKKPSTGTISSQL